MNASYIIILFCASVYISALLTPIAFSVDLDKQWRLSLKKYPGCLDEVKDKAIKKNVCVFVYLWFMYQRCT